MLVNGIDITRNVKILDDGSFIFEIPEGESLVNLYYSGTPYDNFAILLAISGFIVSISGFKILVYRK